jgi:hypothetical protein
MLNETIEARGHTTRYGTLNLSVNVGLPDTDVGVVVHVRELRPAVDVDENGWPRNFFEQVAGSMPGLVRGPQGEFEERLALK